MDEPNSVLAAAQAAVNRRAEDHPKYVTDALMLAATIDADGKRGLIAFWSDNSPFWTLRGMAASIQGYEFSQDTDDEDDEDDY